MQECMDTSTWVQSTSNTMSITYTHILLALTATLLVAVLLVLTTVWNSKPSGIQNLLSRYDENEIEPDHTYLISLMIYEEAYPAFGEIIELVLTRFPLRYFSQKSGFDNALHYLHDSVLEESNSKDLVWAMAHIVNTFVSDPDVASECRPYMEPLVAQFLEQTEHPSQ